MSLRSRLPELLLAGVYVVGLPVLILLLVGTVLKFLWSPEADWFSRVVVGLCGLVVLALSTALWLS